jgi:hypothetical protein
MKEAAERIVPVSLELGGKSPIIVSPAGACCLGWPGMQRLPARLPVCIHPPRRHQRPAFCLQSPAFTPFSCLHLH